MLGVNAETKALKKVHSRLYSSTPQDHTAGIMLILDDSTKTFYHLLLMPFKKKKKSLAQYLTMAALVWLTIRKYCSYGF